ncbi:vacuolar protein sorting-associated protein 3 [Entomortierella parvispora]|uniref:Vacuolar protein sorting-associated protein 3 n=1 Tax=Entomortierella parvispora TaxID=205924 RepID=A0A9P3H455_9FUNG|nr:vacuolar protein sorting-associated protein 3 [Entomortierella parvispora]
MFTTFSVQPLLSGLNLDDSSSGEASSSRASQGGASSPAPKSTSIFNRGGKPIIEALDSFESNLYLGTSFGILLHYVIEEQISSESNLPRSRLLRRTPLGFGKKLVERIMVLPSIRIAIVLCDSTLSFFNLPSFTPCSQQAFPPIRGVTAFCEDGSQRGRPAEDGSIRVCVVKRRIIQHYSIWPDAISDPQELNLANGALVATRWKHIVCVADANDFKLIDLRVGRMMPILPVVQSASTGSNTQVLKPACIAIGENEFLLATAASSGQTAMGIFCSGSGEPVRGTLQWSSYPRSLGIEFPYVAALLRNNIIEIHNILDQKLIQTVRFDPVLEIRNIAQGPGLAVWMSALAHVLSLQTASAGGSSSPEIEKMAKDIHRISIVPARILVAGKDSVSALITTPLVLHADGLLQKGRVEEALLLSERTMATLSSENLHRERLQFELDYIYQKSGLIYLGETLFDDAFGLLQKGRIDPRVLISMFPNVLQQGNIMQSVSLFRGVKEQLEQLGTVPDIITKSLSKSGSDESDEFRDMLLKNATDVFLTFLLKFHKDNIPKKVAGPASQATDTALLGIWVDNEDTENLLQLIESKNACQEDICEQKLKESKQHYVLSVWYRMHKKHSDVLSIWKKLLQNTLKDPSSKVSLEEMASVLMSLHDMDLVEDYGWWIVEQDEDIGLKVFMPGDSKRAAMFDTNRIFDKCRSSLSPKGAMTYLEYIVSQRKSESSDHHTALCLMYVDSITRLNAELETRSKHVDNVERFKSQQEDKLLASALTSRNKNTQESTSTTFLSYLATLMNTDLIAQVRVKLCSLLQSSALYDPEAVLAKIEGTDLLQSERAIVLARMSQFELSIAVLVAEVKDYQGVESFCLHSGSFQAAKKPQKSTGAESKKSALAEEEVRRAMFMALLKEYLNMEQDQGGMKLTLGLLSSHSTFLHISEVIHLLPPYWSVEMLQEYLLRSLRRSYHQRKELQVVKSLCLSENLRISDELYKLYESQGPVVITANDVCHVCGEAVADSVFMRTPELQTVHLHCGPQPPPK